MYDFLTEIQIKQYQEIEELVSTISWYDSSNPVKENEAKEVLLQVRKKLEQVTPLQLTDKEQRYKKQSRNQFYMIDFRCNDHYGYFHYLTKICLAIHAKKYCEACTEIGTYLHFFHAFSKSQYSSLVDILHAI